MIALDTNALVRMLVEDDTEQAKIVQQLVSFAEQKSITVLILPEVLLETVWVLESVYTIKRAEIIKFLRALLAASTFAISLTVLSDLPFANIKEASILPTL